MTIEKIIKSIPNLKFYNVSYRVYFALIDKYIVCVYPFATQIIEYNKPVLNFVENKPHIITFSKVNPTCLNNFRSILWYHHVDFIENRGEYIFDPCMIYEVVSGYKMHTKQETDNINFPKEYFKENANKFNSRLMTNNRAEKLRKLKDFSNNII